MGEIVQFGDFEKKIKRRVLDFCYLENIYP